MTDRLTPDLLRGAGQRHSVAVGGHDVDASHHRQRLVDVQLPGVQLQGSAEGEEWKGEKTSPGRRFKGLLEAGRAATMLHSNLMLAAAEMDATWMGNQPKRWRLLHSSRQRGWLQAQLNSSVSWPLPPGCTEHRQSDPRPQAQFVLTWRKALILSMNSVTVTLNSGTAGRQTSACPRQ